MKESAKVAIRGWVGMLIGAALLVGALVALWFPVYLDSYDRWGMQVRCGNGYYSQLLQATVDDQDQAPATHYVDQCKSAVLHRRAWSIPVAGLGAVILIPELVAWACRGSRSSPSPGSGGVWSAGHPDEEMEEAALLDRHYRSHRPTPHDTTL